MNEFLHFKSRNGRTLPYLITKPENSGEEKLPMILFLHGAGERGDNRELLSVHGIPKYFGNDSEYRGIKAITLSPQCPEEKWWDDIVDELMELVDYIAEKENADTERISVTGLSMGGFGICKLLRLYPDFFSAAAPICGGMKNTEIRTKTPIRAFHGDYDSCVPCYYSYLLVDIINGSGGHCELTVFHGVGHDSWTKAYEETNVIEWLVKQSNKSDTFGC